MNDLCGDCRRSGECVELFPLEECDKFERKITFAELIETFRGLPYDKQIEYLEEMKKENA